MGTVLALPEIFETLSCSCGGVYAMPSNYLRHQRQIAGAWHCPFCRVAWGYAESDIDVIKKKLAKEEQNRQWYQNRLADERKAHEHTMRQLRGTKGAITKHRKRAAAGVCPCCNRTFKQLAAHMKQKHPQYGEQP